MKLKKIFKLVVSLSITIIAIIVLVRYMTVSMREERNETPIEYEKIVESEYEKEVVVQEVTPTKMEEPNVSDTELPKVQDVESAYEIISILDHEDDWILGKVNDDGNKIISDDTYLSLNSYLPMENLKYQITVNDSSYRMIVTLYDHGNNSIGTVDLCNGDILTVDESATYSTITIYKYENRQVVTSHNQNIVEKLKNGLYFTIVKLNDVVALDTKAELLAGEVHIESLSNYLNYRNGWFKSWGGSYENVDGSMCTRNLYQVNDQPYIYNVNDSRITISINEYDAQGNWVNYNEALTNGETFVKQSNTSYIGITIRSRKWGVDLKTMFENGLRIDLASNGYMGKTDTRNVIDIDFTNTNHWIAGGYLFETGDYIIEANQICYDTFCKMEDEEYMVNLPGGYLRMSILELTKDGTVMYYHELQSGQRWKPSNDTEKIAITVFSNEKTYTVQEYKALILSYSDFGLVKYVEYAHNTHMKDITAAEWINQVNVGWNLGNSLDSKAESSSQTKNLKQELNWGNPYITKDLIDFVANSGFNTIRIPVTWYYNTYQDADGMLKISKEWLNRVQEVVDYSLANDMYVILNTHHEQPIIYAGTDDDTMKQVVENARALWMEIAEYFKTYDEHLIFESYNEVDNIEKSWNYSDKAAAQMNELNQIFVDTVRGTGGNNGMRILMVPTLLDGADSRFYSGFMMPKDSVSNKLVVQVHTYSKKFNQDIESEFSVLHDFSKRINAPIVIGEFGTTPTYPLPELRQEQASNFVARAAKYGIKCIWWDNNSDYKIIDRRDFVNSDREMITALLEGAQGIGYQLEQGVVLKHKDQFTYSMPNKQTGDLVYTHWGTLTSDLSGDAVPVQEGSYCSISLKAINEASSIWLQRLLFYDGLGTLIQEGNEIQSRYYFGRTPEHAVTMRVSINSADVNLALEDFEQSLSNGDLEVVIRFFDISDVTKVQLEQN